MLPVLLVLPVSPVLPVPMVHPVNSDLPVPMAYLVRKAHRVSTARPVQRDPLVPVFKQRP